MIARRIGLLASALLVALASTACGGQWTIVKQATPSPLAGVKDYALEGISYPQAGLKVGDKMEDQWLADKKDDEKVEIAKDKADTIEAYVAALTRNKDGFTFTPVPAGQPSTEKFTVRTFWTFLDRGAFTAVFSFPTEMQITVQIIDKSSAVVDEVNFRGQQVSDVFHPTPGQRQRDAAQLLGEQVIKYLKTRAK